MIVEMLANVNLANDIEMLKPRGRVMIVGNRGEITINPRFLMMPETSIRGVALWNITPAEIRSTAEGLEEMATKGLLRPILGESYALEDVQRAHIETIEKSGCIGKKFFKVC